MNAEPMTLLDRFGRPLRDLRISVTDRCNFRCRYCMPREVFGPEFEFLPRDEILSFEEITRLARIFAAHGVQKVRLTGGEPLLRRQLPLPPQPRSPRPAHPRPCVPPSLRRSRSETPDSETSRTPPPRALGSVRP